MSFFLIENGYTFKLKNMSTELRSKATIIYEETKPMANAAIRIGRWMILASEELDSKPSRNEVNNLILQINSGYNGIASSEIESPVIEGYYISLSGGTFPDFGNLYVPEGFSIIYNDNSVWKYESIPLNPNNPVLDTDFFT